MDAMIRRDLGELDGESSTGGAVSHSLSAEGKSFLVRQ
jgi:hypothetical protein